MESEVNPKMAPKEHSDYCESVGVRKKCHECRKAFQREAKRKHRLKLKEKNELKVKTRSFSDLEATKYASVLCKECRDNKHTKSTLCSECSAAYSRAASNACYARKRNVTQGDIHEGMGNELKIKCQVTNQIVNGNISEVKNPFQSKSKTQVHLKGKSQVRKGKDISVKKHVIDRRGNKYIFCGKIYLRNI